MKTLSRVSLLLLLTTTALTLSAHGDELDNPQMGKLTPQMQARLRQLLGAGEVGSIDPASSASASSSTASGGSRSPKTWPVSTALHTGSLRTGHLATSGTLTGGPRLNEDEWRQLFPSRR